MADNDTVLRLKASLDRLLSGTPERTKPDGRISISRINQEAGLSQGAIYYYKDFIVEANKTIEKHKAEQEEQRKQEGSADFQRPPPQLQEALKKEKRLKAQYRAQRDDFKSITDEMIKTNVSLAFRILELEDENQRLTRRKVFELGVANSK
jgi:hypothetical protein